MLAIIFYFCFTCTKLPVLAANVNASYLRYTNDGLPESFDTKPVIGSKFPVMLAPGSAGDIFHNLHNLHNLFTLL
jgi:hypothetical protein